MARQRRSLLGVPTGRTHTAPPARQRDATPKVATSPTYTEPNLDPTGDPDSSLDPTEEIPKFANQTGSVEPSTPEPDVAEPAAPPPNDAGPRHPSQEKSVEATPWSKAPTEVDDGRWVKVVGMGATILVVLLILLLIAVSRGAAG